MGFFSAVVGRIFPSWVSDEMRASLSVGFQFPCFSVGGFSSDGGNQPTLPCSIVWRPDFHRRTNPPNPPHRSVPPKPPHRPKPSKASKQLDFGFVVVGGGGGGVVVNDGDGCDER
uniref:Uncharacterized protein n=1 Tax=Fagus sylvatica TaxID=28930 RepID=A0A2N9HZC9_FAGSY